MKRSWLRLFYAGLLSAGCFLGTWFWYQFAERHSSVHSSEKAIAYVGQTHDDISKKQAAKLLWLPVVQGDGLYDGEAIRTGSVGEVRVEFADSGNYLDLEPDSMIIIKKASGEISLELKEGSLTVAQNTTSDSAGSQTAPSLVLKSEEGSVDLTTASATLSRSKSGTLDLQVLQGEAKVKTKSGEQKKIQTGSMEFLESSNNYGRIDLEYPTLNITFPITTEATFPAKFQWKIPDIKLPIARMELHWGPSRQTMKRQVALTAETSTQQNLTPGKYFWKVIAFNRQDQIVAESSLSRFQITRRKPPMLIVPVANDVLNFDQNGGNVEFKWTVPEESFGYKLQVFSDPEQTVKIADVAGIQNSAKIKIPAKGNYYWKVMTLPEAKSEYLSSAAQKVSLLGKTEWMEAKDLSIKPLKITFLNSEKLQNVTFAGQPQVGLKWTSESPEKVKKWRVSVASEETPENKLNFDTNVAEYNIQVPSKGRYIASVEGLGESGKTLTAPSAIQINFSEKPLVNAPFFIPKEGPMTASPDGESTLKWTAPPGSKSYELVFMKDGKDVKRLSSTLTFLEFKNLLPGQYKVKIRAKDEADRWGEFGSPRDFIIPDTSSVAAPTLKKVKVK